MVDILVLFEKYKNTVAEFLSTDIDFELSWGQKRDFPTQDPFDNVRIRKDKIVIRQTVTKDPIWIVDAVRGLFVAGLGVETPSVWNFVTLVALIMVPTTQISESKKTTYRKQWLAYKPYFTRHSRPYDYERWYKILSGYSRIQVLEILSEFVRSHHLDSQIEFKFNDFLLNMQNTLYDEDDINFIHIVLKHQKIDYSLIHQIYGWSRAKYYRIKSRLDFTVNRYYIPNYSTLGLIRLYFKASDTMQLASYRMFPYYENFENFKDKSDIMYKFIFPFCKLEYLIEAIEPEKLNTPVYFRFPRSTTMYLCPLMFDAKKQTWMSVYDTKREIIRIPSFSPDSKDRTADINSNDLLVLKGVLRSRSTDEKLLGLELSQSVTKRIIRKLQREKFYEELVLWRRSSDLTTIGIFTVLSTYKECTRKTKFSIPSEYENTTMPYSWPFQNTEFCIQLRSEGAQLMYRYAQFAQISGRDDDINKYLFELDTSELIGIYDSTPGSIIVIPDTEFDQEWKFDISEFLRLVEIYS